MQTGIKVNISDKERNRLAYVFTESEYYESFFKPYIHTQTEINNNVERISNDPVTMSYDVIKQKAKISVYRSIINDIERWANHYKKNRGD